MSINTEICRGCLSDIKETFETLWKDDNINLFSMCTHLQVSRHDGLPQYICSACIYKCLMWDNFRKLCTNSDYTLRRILKLPQFDQSSNLIVLLENEIVSIEDRKNIESIVTVEETEETTFLNIEPESEDEFNETVAKASEDPETEQIIENVESSHLKTKSGEMSTLWSEKNIKYDCGICDKTFKSSARYDAHIRTHKLEVCQICNKTFSNSRAIRRHKVKHDNIKRFECKDCPKTYKYATSLTLHKKAHENVKQFMCSLCGKSFLRNHGLQSHLLCHQTELPFKCLECEKSFKNQVMLKNHQQRHSGIKKFECSKCSKKFVTAAELRIHDLSHSGIKSFVCNVQQCKKSYKTKSHLAVHQSVFHDGIKKYACDICSQKFGHKKVLNQHRLKHSNEKSQ